MTTRGTRAKATADTPDTDAEASPDTTPTPDSDGAPAGIEGDTGTVLDDAIAAADLDPALVDPSAAAADDDNGGLVALPELGDTDPVINVTAVQNARGTWTWTARANDDDREIASGGPHHEERLLENLILLFATSSVPVALRRTGDPKPRRLA